MEIAIHLGAHCTDGDRLPRALGEDRATLAEEGVSVPPGGRARPAIRKAVAATQGDAPEAARAALIEGLLGDADADRIVLSYEGFLGSYARVLEGGRLYAQAGARATLLARLFEGHDTALFLAIRNPATFVPAVFEASSLTDFAAFADASAPDRLRWAPVVSDIAAAGVPVTVWCDEDIPLLWPEILHAVAGTRTPLAGEMAILREVMTEAGFDRLRTYLRDNPPPSPAHWRRVATAFLAKYVLEDELVVELRQPGWTEEVVEGLSRAYEAELPEIAAMPGVTFLRP